MSSSALAAEPHLLVCAADHEPPEEPHHRIACLLLVGPDIDHDESDRRFVRIDRAEPGVLREVGLRDRHGVVGHMRLLDLAQGFAQAA